MRFRLQLAIVVGLMLALTATAALQATPQTSQTQPIASNSVRPVSLRAATSTDLPTSSQATSWKNSARLQELIKDEKLELSVEDAIALALENNLDVVVSSYDPSLAEADLLQAKSGGATRGAAGGFQSSSISPSALGSVAGGANSFDPTASFTYGWTQSTQPLGITILQGVPILTTHTSIYTYSLSQAFTTGTRLGISFSGSRQSTTGTTSLFNPQIPTQLAFEFTQPLLNGFGRRVNARFIRIARNNLRFADSSFRQKVMATVAQVLNLYWDVASAREHEEVAQKALGLAEKTLADTTQEAQLGVIARYEKVRASAEVSRQRGSLVRARMEYEQRAEQLKTAISRQVGAELASAELVPSTHIPEPQPGDVPALAEALSEAAANRPEIEQANLSLLNQGIVIRATHNAMLPSLNLFAAYAPQGLSGDRILRDTNGNIVGVVRKGASDSLSQTFHNLYPDYSVGVTFSVPLRNRSAKADLARSLIERRQLETKLQQQKNAVEEDVREAFIAVKEAKVEIEAARDAAATAQQTLDGEQKKFELGESDVFRIVLAQRDLFSAEDSEVAARADYAKALVQAEQAMGAILRKHHIDIGDAQGKPAFSAPPPILDREGD